MTTTTEQIKYLWELMEQVPDPEIPIINLVELGVIREIHTEGDKVIIVITPTYTGCPAKKLFEDLIEEKLAEHNFNNIEIITKIHPVVYPDPIPDQPPCLLENRIQFCGAPGNQRLLHRAANGVQFSVQSI